MTWESNPYNSPEKLGLKIVGMCEMEPDYSFDMFVVWEAVDGDALYMASDSGCSCPSPFEDFSGVESLERIGSYDQFARALDSWRGGYGALSGGLASVDSLRRKVRRRLART